jgi:hypothetical protein
VVQSVEGLNAEGAVLSDIPEGTSLKYKNNKNK